jgi:hypothetical protein
MGYGKAKKNYAMALKKKKSYAIFKKKKGKFPDLNKDGKITKADILMGRGVPRRSKRNPEANSKFNERGSGGTRSNYTQMNQRPANPEQIEENNRRVKQGKRPKPMVKATTNFSIKPKEKKKKVKTDYQYPPSKTKKSVEKNSKFFRTRRLVDKYKSDPPNNVLSDKEFLIKNPFDTSKRLYSRRVVRGKEISSGKPTKTIVTRGESYGSRKVRKKKISEKELNRDYKRNKKKIEKNYSIAVKSNPSLWARKKAEAKAKMGGKHSARAMQLATRLYQKAGGGYRGNKPK